jgi:Conjugative relaxosome accessory transposon protein.
LQSEAAYAGMQGFLSGMFTATSVPQAASLGNGVTLSGGYAEVRTPLSGANIVSFSPPDISAGCGGINLYMGSFHFINGQEFLALLRTIGQEALGYAFQLAIDAMCHQCGALLASIEKTIQAMNNSLHNTCQLAHGIFNAGDIAGDFKQVGKNAEKVLDSVQVPLRTFPLLMIPPIMKACCRMFWIRSRPTSKSPGIRSLPVDPLKNTRKPKVSRLPR